MPDDLAGLPISTRSLPRSLLPAARLVGFTPHLVCSRDGRVSYALYVPARHYDPSPGPGTPLLPVVVALHGTTRQTTPLLAAFQELADESRCAVLAPLFPAGIDGPNDWDSYKELRPGRKEEEEKKKKKKKEGKTGVDGSKVKAKTKESSHPLRADEVLWHVLDYDVVTRWPGLRTDRVALAGFSGGASAAQRLALLYPERVAGVSVAAPGSLTRVRGQESWPAGTADAEEVFDGRGVGSLMDRWQLVVGDADDALEGSLQGLAWAAKGWEDRPEVEDWDALLKSRMRSRRSLLEAFRLELEEEGVGGVAVEVVEGGRHTLKDLTPAVVNFLRRVVEEMWEEGKGVQET